MKGNFPPLPSPVSFSSSLEQPLLWIWTESSAHFYLLLPIYSWAMCTGLCFFFTKLSSRIYHKYSFAVCFFSHCTLFSAFFLREKTTIEREKKKGFWFCLLLAQKQVEFLLLYCLITLGHLTLNRCKPLKAGTLPTPSSAPSTWCPDHEHVVTQWLPLRPLLPPRGKGCCFRQGCWPVPPSLCKPPSPAYSPSLPSLSSSCRRM